MRDLNDRSVRVLRAVIESYITFNKPVGSRIVMRRYPFGLSSATIRNTMADLESKGYVAQPHTSAGRIPTEKGYRFYVDCLLTEGMYSVNRNMLNQLASSLRRIERDIYKLIKEVSKTLSEFSSYLGVATAPSAENSILEHIKFLKHSRNKIVSIVISEEGIVKNKVIVLEKNSFTQRQLDRITNYLNDEFRGLSLEEIRVRIMTQMSKEKVVFDKLIGTALTLCNSAIEWESENLFFMGEISGTCNLPDFASVMQIKELFRAIEEKHLVLRLIKAITASDGVQVLIGSENDLSSMKDLSFVGSTYTDGSRTLGTIGIIGPTRMNYGRVIPIVNQTAKTLTQIFSER